MTAKEHLNQILCDNITVFTTGKTQRNLSEKVRLEEERKNGYHGRELLELLQNVDDAYQELCERDPSKKGKKVTALIEYKNDILTVSNTGTKFTKDTIERLCQGGVSSKSGKYIGSKGTGFRSILNWAKEIYIYSGDYAVKFSEQFAEQQFNKIKDNELVKKQINDRKKLYFPMLYAPEDAGPCTTEYDTVIKIVTNSENIKDDHYNVTNQIKELDYLILIFLPNITDIQIKTDSEDLHFSKEHSEENGLNLVTIKSNKNDKPESFYVFDNYDRPIKINIKNEEEPKEIRLAAAIPKEIMEKEYSIYSFFPIRSAKSPFLALLHGTFILDQHRDSITTDPEQINNQVLKELLDFYVNTVVDNFGKQKFKDYAIRLLTPLGFKNDNKWHFASEFEKFGLEEFYLNLLTKAKFIPTVNGDYISIQDKPKIIKNKFPSIFKGEEFNTLIQFLDNEENVDLVIKLCAQAELNPFYTEDELCTLINKNTEDKNIERWEIEQQVEVFIWWNEEYSNLLPNLLKDSNGAWLKKQQTCFLSEHVSYLPEWAKVTIIDKKYQDVLIKYYKIYKQDEFEKNKKESPNRILTTIVNKKELVNLQEQYTDNLISPVNSSIEDDYNKSAEFVKWLWTSYRDREFKDTALEIKYKFPDKDKKVKPADSLYFGIDYGNELGVKLMRHTDMSCFEAPAVFGIADDDIDEFKKFFNRLGVALFPKIEKTDKPCDEYQYKIKSQCENFKNFVSFTVDDIHDIKDILTKVEMETIFLWIKNDDRLYKAINIGKESAKSIIKYHKNGRWEGYDDFISELNIHSYLLFLFSNLKWINISGNVFAPNECIFNDEKRLLNIFPCITNEIIKEISRKSKINTDEIKNLLRRLGVKEKIIEYESGKFYFYLLKLSDPNIDKNGEISKRIYRQCIDTTDIEFSESQEKTCFFNEGKVYAKNKDKTGFYPVNHVFFSSSAVLNISNKLLIETPHRSGSTKRIKEIFNVNEFEENYRIIDESIILNTLHNNKFQDEFKDFLRYAFCYEAEETSENEIKLFQNIKIILVSKIKAIVDDEEFTITEDYSIIKHSRSYWYIFISEEISKLDEIKLSVAIEEIFKIILNFPAKPRTDKIGELYRANEITRKSLIKKDFGSLDILAEADRKLGNTETIKNNFNKIIQDNSNYDREAELIIEKMDFYDFDSINNQKYLVELLKKLNWDISELQDRNFEIKVDFTDYFKKLIYDYINNNKRKYENSLYKKLKGSDIANKGKFLKMSEKFNNFEYETLIKNSVFFNPEEIILSHFQELKDDIEDMDLVCIFSKNLKSFREGKDQNIIEDMLNNDEYKSLFYFGELEFLDKEYNKIKDSAPTDSIDNDSKDSDDPKKTPIVTDSPIPKGPEQTSRRKHKTGKTVSIARENAQNEKNQKQGDDAEKCVVEKLRSRGIETVCRFVNSTDYHVEWVSGAAQRIESLPGDDNLHYDIRIKINNQIVLYIEVKSSSESICKFKLSKDEYDFAKKNADNYMVIFVGDMESVSPKITPLKMKFWTDEIRFHIEPNNYTVTCIYNDENKVSMPE